MTAREIFTVSQRKLVIWFVSQSMIFAALVLAKVDGAGFLGATQFLATAGLAAVAGEKVLMGAVDAVRQVKAK